MPASITRTKRHRRPTRNNFEANQPQPVTPILITDLHISGSQITLTFDQAVTLNGIPAFTTELSEAKPISAHQTAPNIVVLIYASAVGAPGQMIVGYRDPAIRSASGGYVTSITFSG